jgi:hypothetical protein
MRCCGAGHARRAYPARRRGAGRSVPVLAQIAEPVLVIADNASSAAQVRLLLPSAGPHKVLVTSRHTLAGLGARLVDVTVLNQETSIALLDAALRAAWAGDDRISDDRQAAGRLAQVCGGLPLALLNADPALARGPMGAVMSSPSSPLRLFSATGCPHGKPRPGGTSARTPGWSSPEAVDSSFCPCSWVARMSNGAARSHSRATRCRPSVTSARCQVSM